MKKRYLYTLLLLGSIATCSHVCANYQNFTDEERKIDAAYKKVSSQKNIFDDITLGQKNILDFKSIMAELEAHMTEKPLDFSLTYRKMFKSAIDDINKKIINSIITATDVFNTEINKTKRPDLGAANTILQSLKKELDTLANSAAVAKKSQDDKIIRDFKLNLLHVLTLIEKVLAKISTDYEAAAKKAPSTLVKTSRSRNLSALTQPAPLTQKTTPTFKTTPSTPQEPQGLEAKKELVAPKSKILGETAQEPSVVTSTQPSLTTTPKAPPAPTAPPAPQPKVSAPKTPVKKPQPKPQTPTLNLQAELQKKFAKTRAYEEKEEVKTKAPTTPAPSVVKTPLPNQQPQVTLGKKIIVQGPPPMPGVLSLAEYEGIKSFLGAEYDAFNAAMKEKDIRAKSWNTLTNDKDLQEKGADLAQLFKTDKNKFNALLQEIDKAKDGKAGANIISSMLVGKAVTEKKPTTAPKPVSSPSFNAMPYIAQMKDILSKDMTTVSPLLPGKLLGLKTKDDFIASYKQATQKDASGEAIKLYETYKEESSKIQPVGLTIEKKQQPQQQAPQPTLLSIVQSKAPQGEEVSTKRTEVTEEW